MTCPGSPARVPCVICGGQRSKRRRRGACVACYRKYRASGIPLPAPMPPPGFALERRPLDPLQPLVDGLSAERKLTFLRLLLAPVLKP